MKLTFFHRVALLLAALLTGLQLADFLLATHLLSREFTERVHSELAQGASLVSTVAELHTASSESGAGVWGTAIDQSFAQTLSELTGMQVTLIRKPSDPELLGSTLNPTEQAALQELLAHSPVPLNIWTATLNGIEHMTQAVPLTSGTLPAFALLHLTPEALSGHFDDRRQRLLMAMAIGLALALAAALWLSALITRPVKLLAQAATRIHQGNYDIAHDKSLSLHRGDEVGKLVSVFAEMQTGIAHREAMILHQTLFDELTDLPNRLQTHDLLHSIVSTHADGRCTVILLSLTQHCRLVDTLGQVVGEKILIAMAERLQSCVTDALLVGRVSTSEFLLVIPQGDDPDLIAYIQGQIAEIVQPVCIEQAEMIPQLTAGVVVLPEDAKTAAQAIRRASIALSEARDSHVSVSRYIHGRDESQIRSLALVADLKKAVEEDQLLLHYQPKVSVATNTVNSVEALVRWIHPQHGFMPPNDFISLAECSGYINMLTQWVLNSAIAQVSEWQKQGLDIKVAVNLSAMDLRDESLFSSVEQLLLKHDVATSSIIIEITESAMLRDAEQALSTLRLMRAHGFTIAIDDFGTGYSSLSKLKELPVDELKIDRAFVTNVEPDTVESRIVQAIINLGHSVGLTVVAEGIETQEVWDLMASMGGDAVQGYFVSRPLDAADLTQWLTDRKAPPSARAA